MSFEATVFSSGPFRDISTSEEELSLFDQLTRASHFLRDVRHKLRHGELSRSPLKILRFQVAETAVECDWMIRPADPWDTDLSAAVRQRHTSLQALKDALNVRALLFDAFPTADSAEVRVFRESEDYTWEMVISGSLHRNDNTSRQVHSIVMRAKVLGFRFRMENEILRKI